MNPPTHLGVQLGHELPEGVRGTLREIELLRSWTFEPSVVVPMVVAAGLYLAGQYRIWARAGVGAGVKRWEARCWWAGVGVLVIALMSPLHPWGSVLFSAHMTQHELLMLVAAPLCVLGRPLGVMMAGLPRRWARGLARASNVRAWTRAWGAVSNAWGAWLLHAGALWAWHVPVLFNAVVENEWVHALQHASFFLTACLFWWAAMQAGRAAAFGAAVLGLFTTALHSGLLGAMITFAEHLWYPAYRETTTRWGLTPLEDQQLGGLIMWVPAGVVYIGAALLLMVGWMREGERRARRWQAGLG